MFLNGGKRFKMLFILWEKKYLKNCFAILKTLGNPKSVLMASLQKNTNKKNYFQECICNTISAFCLLNALENKLYSNSSVLHFQPRHIACKWHLVILEMSYYAFLIAFRDFAFCTKYIINSAVRVCYSEHNSPLFK